MWKYLIGIAIGVFFILLGEWNLKQDDKEPDVTGGVKYYLYIATGIIIVLASIIYLISELITG